MRLGDRQVGEFYRIEEKVSISSVGARGKEDKIKLRCLPLPRADICPKLYVVRAARELCQ